MSHHHHHHQHPAPQSINGVLVFSIVLNLAFVFLEALIGLWVNSMSLLSDAGHNLSDVFSLILVMVAFRLSKVQSNRKYTYGYKKSTVLISLVNAVILLVAVGVIIMESIHKFESPAEINGAAVSWTAGVGIIINGLTVILLMKGQKNDLNVRGAFLHMVADTLVSVGVLASGIVISYTGWYLIDPILSIVIALVILLSTWSLLTKSVRLSLDGTPYNVDIDQVEKLLNDDEHVKEVHHIHVWAISTTENAMTAHVVIDRLEYMEEVKHRLKHRLEEAGIAHSTLEMETSGCHCHAKDC